MLSLLAPVVLLSTVGSIDAWWKADNDKAQGNSSIIISTNKTEHGLIITGTNETKDWISGSTRELVMKKNPSNTIPCLDRDGIMEISDNAQLTVVLSGVIQMLVLAYFYYKIYRHLKAERRRFKSSQQVVTRLHNNSRAVQNTLLAAILCHLVLQFPLLIAIRLGASTDYEAMIRLFNQTVINGATLCFLALHGGFR